MIKGRFKEEQDIIDDALALRQYTPRQVRDYISHFLRNDLTLLQGECKGSRKALDVIQHMSQILRILGM